MGVNTRYLAVAAMGLMVSACGGLKQSALIYSSQNNIGLVARGGTAQAGNADLTLGYSGHDFAIVPVAVAETCTDPAKQEACDRQKYRLVRIEGNNSVDAAAQAMAALASQISEQSRMKMLEQPALNQALARLNADIQTFNTISGLTSEINAKNRALTALTPAPTPESDVAQPAESIALETENARKVASLRQEIEDLEARKASAMAIDPVATSGARDALIAQIASIDAFVERNERKLQEIIDGRADRSTDTKHDALSVYGEFGGGNTVDGGKASLQVGKLFSTGVAAQNLTQQMREVLALQGREKCIQAATQAIANDTRLAKASPADLTQLYIAAMKVCTPLAPVAESKPGAG